jgi:hypothetical protein
MAKKLRVLSWLVVLVVAIFVSPSALRALLIDSQWTATPPTVRARSARGAA